MKVLHVISGLDTGGAELFLERLILGLAPPDFSHAVISLRRMGPVGARLIEMGIPVDALNIGANLFGLNAIAGLRRVVRRETPDLIQGWMYHGNLGASLARRMAGIHCPVTWNIRHSLDDWRGERIRLRAVIRLGGMFSGSATRILYNSTAAARQHEQRGYSRVKTMVINNGIDCSRFHPDAGLRPATRRQLGLDADAVVIGMLARFHPVKDHATLLAAARIVQARIPQSRFLLVGHCTTRDNPALAALLKKYQLNESVLALGKRQDIPALLSAMDVHVSASRAEGFPNAVGEAMACGVPCVVTDVGASRELVGDTGVVVPPGSERELAEAIIEMAAESASQRHDAGKAARERVIRLYSMEQCISTYAGLYASLARPAA